MCNEYGCTIEGVAGIDISIQNAIIKVVSTLLGLTEIKDISGQYVKPKLPCAKPYYLLESVQDDKILVIYYYLDSGYCHLYATDLNYEMIKFHKDLSNDVFKEFMG